jgi:hypothetical protein
LKWTKEASGTTNALADVWGNDSGDVYAVGAQGTVLHSSGDGVWTGQPTSLLNTIIQIAGTSRTDIHAISAAMPPDSGYSLHSDGNGVWTHEARPNLQCLAYLFGNASQGIFRIQCEPPSHNEGVYHLGSMGWEGVLATYDLNNAVAVTGDGTDLYVVTGLGDFYHRDAGGGWEVQKRIADVAFGVWAANHNDVYVLSSDLLHSTGNGHWDRQLSSYVSQIWGSSASDLYAISYDSSSVYKSNGNGSWQPEKVGDSTSSFYGIWGSSCDDVYIVGKQGEIWHGH